MNDKSKMIYTELTVETINQYQAIIFWNWQIVWVTVGDLDVGYTWSSVGPCDKQ